MTDVRATVPKFGSSMYTDITATDVAAGKCPSSCKSYITQGRPADIIFATLDDEWFKVNIRPDETLRFTNTGHQITAVGSHADMKCRFWLAAKDCGPLHAQTEEGIANLKITQTDVPTQTDDTTQTDGIETLPVYRNLEPGTSITFMPWEDQGAKTLPTLLHTHYVNPNSREVNYQRSFLSTLLLCWS